MGTPTLFWRLTPLPGLCLRGERVERGRSERMPSGHRGCDSGRGGGYWRLEMRLGLLLRYGNAFGVEARPECWGEPPPPPSSDSLPPPSNGGGNGLVPNCSNR